ncbi:tRNA lysidine(34) synthetase TilS [Mycoplasma sp. CSL7491-lung]|uniref:tRNA lysidine(34) synthetase TilS n=1 Tax=Mycoplasma sp. CSL7491-lung TaxID=549718 RepID=UPI001C0F7843|nr:tRNA lysidine(34) synthetase TilS [Mycoplasma sp. CSL7491-lung]MBU4693267.1 tRNA lysidine(34) synthetase TilS [Mycoplasma sp. CSL7491-lung]
MLTKNKKYLIAVSGGPDSMFLLNKFKNKNVVVAHVNYNQRKDSYEDQKIVKNFCFDNNIDLQILELKKEDYISGNFQEWARNERYSFFKEIYDKKKCDVLLVAHNIDDFLETSILQINSGRKPLYYGIKRTNNIYGMNIIRPLLFKYFKSTIENKCLSKKIPFHIDYTNLTNKYSRNKIRNVLKKKYKIYKLFLLAKIIFKNSFLKFKKYKIYKEYYEWEKKDFSIDFFRSLKYKHEVLFKFLNENNHEINLSNQKINSIIKFILSKTNNKIYKLNNNFYLSKKNWKLFIKNSII